MQRKKRKIVAISGSTKSTSTSLFILEYLKIRFKDQMDLSIYNKLDKLPHFNPDTKDDKLPSSVVELRDLIKNAEGILFCTPEYVFSLPGSLKNLIEWNVSTTLFSSKPVAMIVAAASGKKAFESLDLILTTIESILPADSKLLIQGAKGKIDSSGKITDDEVVLKLDKITNSLLNTIEDKNQKPTKF